MNPIKSVILSILGGMCISLGATAFLSLDNKVLGAIFFSVGLFTILTFGFNLYTGKVCYVFENDKAYALNIAVIWVGNLLGAIVTAFVEKLTRFGPALMEKAQTIAEAKLSDNLLSIFILSILCNIMIYIAVDGYKNNPHEVGKYLAVFFGVTIFIICGFEHSVANMYYFSMAGVWSPKTLLYEIVMTAGNAVGGFMIPQLKRLMAKYD